MSEKNTAMTVEESAQLTTLATRLAALEYRLSTYKKMQEEQKQLKERLYTEMEKHGVKSWEMPDGTKITKVDGAPETEREVEVFDEHLLKAEAPDIYAMYTHREIKKDKGRKGYVRITLRNRKDDG